MRALHTSLAPNYGYAPKGERLIGFFGTAKPGQEHHAAALEHDHRRRDGAVAGRIEGVTTARVFKTYYVEKVLVPSLRVRDRDRGDGQPAGVHRERLR